MDMDILSRRVLIVTGKGGVGKTTVVAALGLAAARRGIETVLVEIGQESSIPPLLGAEVPPPDPRGLDRRDGRDPIALEPHLYWLRLEPRAALTEYLELQLPVRALVRLLVGNAGFQRLLDAAPGWRELITLGKLWHLETREAKGGGPRWGLLIVDAPATGHGLSLLSVPNVVIDTIRLGPLRRQTDAVQALMRDPERTLVVPVTLLEELPVQETTELVARLRELGLAPGPLVANRLEPEPGLPELAALNRALDDISLPPLPGADALREIAAHGVTRAALQREFAEELERRGTPARVRLPQLDDGFQERAGLERLADALGAAFAPGGAAS